MTNKMANNTKEDDIFITVRGLQIPKEEVEYVEHTYGAKLVRDGEWALLHALDRTLFEYRKKNGHDPDLVKLLDHPNEVFKHMVMNIELYGMTFPGSYTKPAWFRFKKQYQGIKHINERPN